MKQLKLFFLKLANPFVHLGATIDSISKKTFNLSIVVFCLGAGLNNIGFLLSHLLAKFYNSPSTLSWTLSDWFISNHLIHSVETILSSSFDRTSIYFNVVIAFAIFFSFIIALLLSAMNAVFLHIVSVPPTTNENFNSSINKLNEEIKIQKEAKFLDSIIPSASLAKDIKPKKLNHKI